MIFNLKDITMKNIVFSAGEVEGVIHYCNKILDDAIQHYGEEAQYNKTIEECAELIVAIRQFIDTQGIKCSSEGVASEIADVIIMALQAAKMIGIPMVVSEIDRKLDRLNNRIVKENYRLKADTEDPRLTKIGLPTT